MRICRHVPSPNKIEEEAIFFICFLFNYWEGRHVFPPSPRLYTLRYIYLVSHELTFGESGSSWPSSIGISLRVLERTFHV